MRKLVLLDIDGTILWTDGAGRRAIGRALVHEAGTAGPIDGYRFDGKTDPQIVRELLSGAGHPDATDIAQVDRVCERYVEFLAQELAAHAGGTTVFPGVLDLMAAIEADAGLILGLLTGNVAPGAALKLGAAGIAFDRFGVGAFGSDAADRGLLPAVAAERAERLMGRRPTGHDVVIIGDTPADMRCGQAIGARGIGVATGAYSVAELTAAGGWAAFPDLSDTAAVLDAIVA